MLMKTPKDFNVDEVTVRNVFGSTIDVLAYHETFDKIVCEEKQTDATFVKFGWFDISDYAFDDERLENIGIRADQNTTEDADDMFHSLSHKGWDAGHFPIIVSTNGRIKDGRTRIRASILAGEQYVPCAIFDYEDDDSVLSQISNGLVANIGDPQRIAKGNDFVVAGVQIILAGQMKCEFSEVEHWLYHTVKIERVMNNVGGNITKIVQRILDKAKRNKNGQLLEVRDRDAWRKFLEASLDENAAYYRNTFGIQKVDEILLYVSNGNKDAMTFCEHILPNAAKGIVTNVVLYSPIDDPVQSVKNHKDFIESIEKYHGYMYDWVNRELSGIKLTAPESSLWRVIGVMPQFVELSKHRKLLKNHMLASINDLPVYKEDNNINGLFDD